MRDKARSDECIFGTSESFRVSSDNPNVGSDTSLGNLLLPFGR